MLRRGGALVVVLVFVFAVPILAGYARADMGNASASYNAAPPAFGSGGDTTVPAGGGMRSGFGSLTLSPTVLSAANVTISICGGGVLEDVNVPPSSGDTQNWAYSCHGT